VICQKSVAEINERLGCPDFLVVIITQVGHVIKRWLSHPAARKPHSSTTPGITGYVLLTPVNSVKPPEVALETLPPDRVSVVCVVSSRGLHLRPGVEISRRPVIQPAHLQDTVTFRTLTWS